MRDAPGVHGPGAACAEQRIVARIAAALGDVHARGGRHVLVDDVVDAPRDVRGRQPHAPGEPLQRGARRRHVHADLAAGEVVGVEIAEQEVRVGHRGLGAAEAVGRRARVRARAARADLEQPDLVDGGDGAAAGADLDQLDGGDADRQPAALHETLLPRGLERVRGERLAAVHERELGGRAPHVEREQVAAAVLAAEERGGQRAGGRARLEHLDRRPLGLGDVGETAAREHQEQRRGDAETGHPPGHRVEILARQRLDVGVGDRRRRALVLADLGRDLVRRGDGDPAVPSGDGARGLRLVLAVRVGVQEDDGDRRHARVDERLGSRGDLARVEPPLHRAVGAQPLTYLHAPIARHERLGLDDVEVVQLELPLAADLQRVAEAGGGDEPRHRAAALDQRVGEERGGVHDPREVARGQAMLAQQAFDARGDGAGGVVVGREDLAVQLAPARVVVDDDVGERAADVDPERVAHLLTFRSSKGAE